MRDAFIAVQLLAGPRMWVYMDNIGEIICAKGSETRRMPHTAAVLCSAVHDTNINKYESMNRTRIISARFRT